MGREVEGEGEGEGRGKGRDGGEGEAGEIWGKGEKDIVLSISLLGPVIL